MPIVLKYVGGARGMRMSIAGAGPRQPATTATYAKDRDTGRGTGPVIFVTSQGLYYDSIVVVDPLPAQGWCNG